MKTIQPTRGFTLFIAMILTSVILTVGLALLDVAYKQTVLTSTARQSVSAFYNADGALECALFEDSYDEFDYATTSTSGTFTCQGSTIRFTYPSVSSGADRTATFTIPSTSNYLAQVSVVKKSSGNTQIYADGYNNANSGDPNRDERGIEAKY